MRIFKSVLLGPALCLGLSTPLFAQDMAEVTTDTVVATVGGVDITVGHMIAMTTSLPDEQLQLPIGVIFEGVLERLVQQEAIAQSQPEPSRLTTLQIENERRSLIASNIVDDIAGAIEPDDADIQAAYDRRFADFAPPVEYNASHILVETEAAAAALVTQLAEGADFAELAKQHSTGPSGPGGGELGWFGPGRMVAEFEAAVVALEKGQVSAPVQTQFGWHVIILNDTRLPGQPTLDDVRAELEQEVWQETLRTRITDLVEAVDIDRLDVTGIDPNILADLTLFEN